MRSGVIVGGGDRVCDFIGRFRARPVLSVGRLATVDRWVDVGWWAGRVGRAGRMLAPSSRRNSQSRRRHGSARADT